MLSLQLRLLVIALRVYARVPLPRGVVARAGGDPGALALRHLPLVGVAVAVPAAVVYVLAAQWLPHAVAVLAAMLASLLLGGAVHERGLAAWFGLVDRTSPDDATGAGARGTGAIAVLAISGTMLARLETLSSLDPSWIAAVLVCAAAWSRGCAVLVAASIASERPGAGLATALLLAAAPSVAAAFWTGDPVVWGTAAALGLFAAGLLRRQTRLRIDPQRRAIDAVLGAAQVIAELAFLAGVLATLTVVDETAEPDYS